MKRHELYLKIWQDCRGMLKPDCHIAIIGGGISGLHLAWFLRAQQLQVTVYEPQRIGSLRIPLMHACSTLKTRPPLWETAAIFSRTWYQKQALHTKSILLHENSFGDFFVIRTRSYLRFLRDLILNQGVLIECARITKTKGFDLVIIASGADSQHFFPEDHKMKTLPIHGWESYFSAPGLKPHFTSGQAKRNEVTTNFMEFPPRAGLIHRNDDERQAAKALAREIFPNRRAALFEGVRLASVDRYPIVGFFPPPEIHSYDRLRVKFQKENYAALASRYQSPFFFTAMGYHAMTYAPFLAQSVASWLTGSGDENLICTLTPARFLPRN